MALFLAEETRHGESRSTPRVDLPIRVIIEGKSYRAKDWGVGGFSLAKPVRGLRIGEIASVRLILGGDSVGGFQLELPVSARVARQGPNGALGFQFVALSPKQAELLHRVVDEYLAGQAPAIETIISEASGQAPRRELSALNRLRAGVQLLLAVFALCLVAWLLAPSLLTIDAPYAATTKRVHRLAATEGGVLEKLFVSGDQVLSLGTPLFSLVSPDARRDAVRLQGQQAELKALREQQMGRLLEIQEVTDRLLKASQEELTALEGRIAALDEKIQIEKRQLARLIKLSERGHSSESAVDAQRRVVSEAKEHRAELYQQKATLSADLQLAQSGIYERDLRDNVPTVDAMLRRIDETDAAIKSVDEGLAALEEAALFRSPCHCRVHALHASEGELVTRGQVLLLLVPDQVPSIEALIPAEKARRLRIGDPAEVELADGSKRTARIADIAYDSGRPDRTGLPERVFAAERYARVVLADESLAGLPVGMTAKVALKPNWWHKILNLTL